MQPFVPDRTANLQIVANQTFITVQYQLSVFLQCMIVAEVAQGHQHCKGPMYLL